MTNTLEQVIKNYETLGGLWTKEAVRLIVEKVRDEERERCLLIIKSLESPNIAGHYPAFYDGFNRCKFEAEKAIREPK